jgi:hypothetical protein
MAAMTREEELWDKLVDEAGEDLIEEAAAVSVEQAERELAAAGFDVAEERARAEAFLASLESAGAAEAEPRLPAAPLSGERAEPLAASKPGAAPRRDGVRTMHLARRAGWIAAAAVAAGAAIYVKTRPETVSGGRPDSNPTASPDVRRPDRREGADANTDVTAPDAFAADLRRRAIAAYNTGHARECLALLDEAAKKDPAGDATPEVATLRRQAEGALRAKPK